MSNIQSVLDKIQNKITEVSTYSKDKSDKHGEVFTPPALINEMLDQLPKDVWSDKNKTWFDPAAGNGNFHIQVLKRLFVGLEDEFPNEEERLRHIIENQLYFAEYQKPSAEFTDLVFSFGGRYNVNLYVGNTLEMPKNYFDLDWEERREKYPENTL